MNTTPRQIMVVGIDGSDNSDAALDWAVAEATARKLRLHLFSAGTQHFPAGEAMYYDLRLDAAVAHEAFEAVGEGLAAAYSRAHSLSPDLTITTQAAVEGAARGLIELSAGADTVVVGRSGHGRVVGEILGAVAHQVVTHAHCPVVVVDGSSTHHAGARGVVVGVDGSSGSELALGYAFEQASRRDVSLEVVHAWWSTVPRGLTRAIRDDQVNEETLTLSEALVGWSEKYPDVKLLRSLPVDGSVVHSLIDAAKNAELLVVGSRGSGGFRTLLLGSVSQGVIQRATCTVAVVRARGFESVN